jgi:insertion element IS1 protein InsB
MKALAVLPYALGNVSQGMIAKLLGVSHVAVYKWIRAAGEDAPAPAATPEDNIVQIDEMWHFVDGKNKVRLWRAFDPVARRTLAWEPGGRDDATCRRLLDRVGLEGHVFVTDDWEGFRRLIPGEQLFTGKDLTFPIEQDNSEVRHHLARSRRRSKVTSRARHMVDGALKLLCHLRRPENFLPLRDNFLSIFG